MSVNVPSSTARGEGRAVLFLAVVFASFLLPALVEARKEHRDGIRREHLAHMKRLLEDYHNRTGAYPASPRQPRETCARSGNTDDWFFGTQSPLRAQKIVTALPDDPYADRGWYYAYCVTSADGSSATAWHLRARLERTQKPEQGFDLEKDHNFYFRVAREENVTTYDICGGSDRCGVQEDS